MNEWKVEQLKKMLDYERKQQPEQRFGAHLEHWSGCAKPINIDAGALIFLIHYYELKDKEIDT